MSPPFRLAKRCRMTGSKLLVAYIAVILTLSLLFTIYEAAR